MNESNFEKTLLYIDSVDREPNSNINDFIVNLELPKRRIKYIQVHSIEIANCIYPIRSNYNNKFQFIDTGSTTRTITIDDGSYGIDTLLTTIETKMN